MTKEEAVLRLDEIYRSMPNVHCEGKCQEGCGPVVMSPLEWDRIKTRLGYEPVMGKTTSCPMLNVKKGTCRVYEMRPFICRAWGVARGLDCPFGCQMGEGEKKLSQPEALAIRDEIKALSKLVFPDEEVAGPGIEAYQVLASLRVD